MSGQEPTEIEIMVFHVVTKHSVTWLISETIIVTYFFLAIPV